MLWLILIAVIAVVGAFYVRMNARAEHDASNPDTGSAMVEFGRAFPDEAIRALHSTIDGKAIFLRLHDGKAGFIQSHGTHYVCHVIHPGKLRVNSSESGQGLIVHFPDFAYLDNNFEFQTAAEAAEVSLWLLGSFSPKSEIDAPLAGRAAAQTID
ncbi:hypothetical protein [Sinorhizobium fredii]|uniref:Uncharacterized protein n=2 Tax=Rhizobium fredii TaxID=380 RepID=A0A2A6LU03_RHIFR|nr:hypothetical protein [Sinorhizobium fredii]KSV80735.1 hypothetical protein N181_07150 [Sinorhizobium fredii USDA 205]MCG5474397.1 hypothetical protein [Sinorhizobium fredii]MQX09013.1 hypothetical protein [Sinorhizobium fredii]PDT45817.1 hypothetical protein CO661_21910 [Sinorhizobium fredii]CCE95762.1 conserved hypothetical protein [Sinorhizobium fredii HH103]